MRLFATCTLSLLLLATNLFAQSNSRSTVRFEKALEDQLSCKQKPDPLKAVRALQKAGVISKSPYVIVDSLSYFRVERPVKVFGLEVIAVIAFEDDSKLFRRGPGTSPGTTLGIVVPNKDVDVKWQLKDLTSEHIMIQDSDDYFERKSANQSRLEVRTEITCSGSG